MCAAVTVNLWPTLWAPGPRRPMTHWGKAVGRRRGRHSEPLANTVGPAARRGAAMKAALKPRRPKGKLALRRHRSASHVTAACPLQGSKRQLRKLPKFCRFLRSLTSMHVVHSFLLRQYPMTHPRMDLCSFLVRTLHWAGSGHVTTRSNAYASAAPQW